MARMHSRSGPPSEDRRPRHRREQAVRGGGLVVRELFVQAGELVVPGVQHGLELRHHVGAERVERKGEVTVVEPAVEERIGIGAEHDAGVDPQRPVVRRHVDVTEDLEPTSGADRVQRQPRANDANVPRVTAQLRVVGEADQADAAAGTDRLLTEPLVLSEDHGVHSAPPVAHSNSASPPGDLVGVVQAVIRRPTTGQHDVCQVGAATGDLEQTAGGSVQEYDQHASVAIWQGSCGACGAPRASPPIGARGPASDEHRRAPTPRTPRRRP